MRRSSASTQPSRDLADDLDAGRLRNAELIRQYADRVRDSRPDLRDLVDVLAREGTRNGTMYQSLHTRLDDVRKALPDTSARDEAYVGVVDELNSLARAVVPAEFDRALADPLNVIADLSDGALPRVDAISAAASQRANGATDLGVGSQLVGNPNYGQWRTDSSGTSFWVWYGQFALMRDLIGGPRIGYGAWAGGRDYSYYHDYGRNNYTSPSARTRQAQVDSTARRKIHVRRSHVPQPVCAATARRIEQRDACQVRLRESFDNRGHTDPCRHGLCPWLRERRLPRSIEGQVTLS